MRHVGDAVIPERFHALLNFLRQNDKIVPLTATVGPELLRHWTTEVRQMMDDGDPRWQELVPQDLVALYEQQLARA